MTLRALTSATSGESTPGAAVRLRRTGSRTSALPPAGLVIGDPATGVDLVEVMRDGRPQLLSGGTGDSPQINDAGQITDFVSSEQGVTYGPWSRDRLVCRGDNGWTDRDKSRWPVPYWYIDTGFTALLIPLAVVDEGLGAVFFGIQPGIMADFRTRFEVPGEWTPIDAIAIGYGDRVRTRCRPRLRVSARAWTSWCTAAGGDGSRSAERR